MQVLIKGVGQGLDFETGRLTHEIILEVNGAPARIEVDVATAERFVSLIRNGQAASPPAEVEEEPPAPPPASAYAEDDFDEFGSGGDMSESITFNVPEPFRPTVRPEVHARMPGDPVPAKTVPKDEYGYPVTGLRPPPEDDDDFDPGQEDFGQI